MNNPIQTTLFDADALVGKEDKMTDILDILMEITCKTNYNNYNPVSTSKLSRLLQADALFGKDIMDMTSIKSDMKKAFKRAIKSTRREDTVVVFPAHFLPSGTDTPYSYRHKSLFTEVICSLKSRENERPRILCLSDNNPELRNKVTGAWQSEYIKKSESGYGIAKDSGNTYDRKGSNDPVVPLDYKSLTTPHYDKIATALKQWLAANPEVKNVIFSDANTANHTFGKEDLPASFGAGAYKVFDTTMLISYEGKAVHKKYKVTYIPSILHLNDYNDRAYDIASDMLSIIMQPGTPFFSEDDVKEIKTVKEIEAVIKYAKKKNIELSVDIETTGRNPNYPDQKIISAAISQGTKAWFFLMDHTDKELYNPEGMAMFDTLMQSGVPLILQNASFDIKWYKYFTKKYPKGKIYDTMLLDHWLHESQGSISKFMGLGYGYGMDNQIPRYLRVPSHKKMLDTFLEGTVPRNPEGKVPSKLGRDKLTLSDLQKVLDRQEPDAPNPWYEPGSGTYAQLPKHVLMRYNCFDAMATYRIYKAQCFYIDQECGGRDKWPIILTDILEMCIENAVEMELEGAPIDYDAIFDKLKEVDRDMNHCRSKVEQQTNNRFDINSGDQALKYLIKYEGVHKDEFWDLKTNKLVADNAHLKKLIKVVPWMDDYLSYRKASKLRNTYLIPIFYKSYRGKLYYSINLTGTATGRLSASDPNIQNFPPSLTIRGKKIGLKEVIRVPEGYTLADMDLSSAEVKVLTVVCPDKTLIDVLNKGLDPHSYTASLISKATDLVPMTYDAIVRSHKIKDEEIIAEFTKEDADRDGARKNAKSVTFGSIYRAGKRGLASQLTFEFEAPDTCNTIKKRVLARQAEGEAKAEALLELLFNTVYPELKKTFATSDRQVLFENYGESLFGRRRRYYYTTLPVISQILKATGLDSKHNNIDDLTSFVPSKHNFRQNVNFLVQSPTTDYMQIFLHYIRKERTRRGLDAIFHFTVHDSGAFSFKDTEANKKLFRDICDEGMNKYLPSISDELKVVIGYGLVFSRLYSPVKKKV